MGTRITKLTSKGQVVIPAQLRRQERLHIGDSVTLAAQDHDVQVSKRSGWAHATAGCLPSALPPIEPDALDEMTERLAIQETHEKYGVVE